MDSCGFTAARRCALHGQKRKRPQTVATSGKHGPTWRPRVGMSVTAVIETGQNKLQLRLCGVGILLLPARPAWQRQVWPRPPPARLGNGQTRQLLAGLARRARGRAGQGSNDHRPALVPAVACLACGLRAALCGIVQKRDTLYLMQRASLSELN